MTMKRGLLVFLAVCAFASAMVPRDRRAVNTEEEEELLRSQSTTTISTDKAGIKVCAPQTPCGWSIYRTNTKEIEMNITNTYCECGLGTVCQINEDESSASAYVHRCRPPAEEDES